MTHWAQDLLETMVTPRRRKTKHVIPQPCSQSRPTIWVEAGIIVSLGVLVEAIRSISVWVVTNAWFWLLQSTELLQFAQITRPFSLDLHAGTQVIISAGLKVVENVCGFHFFKNSEGGRGKDCFFNNVDLHRKERYEAFSEICWIWKGRTRSSEWWTKWNKQKIGYGFLMLLLLLFEGLKFSVCFVSVFILEMFLGKACIQDQYIYALRQLLQHT